MNQKRFLTYLKRKIPNLFRTHFPGSKRLRLLMSGMSHGLTKVEAEQRLIRDGANRIEQKKQRTVWRIIRDQFSSIVVWLLAFAAAVAWLTENDLEALAILVVVILNAAIGFAIEWQAGRALEALKKATKMTARVRRDGHEQIIDAENLAAGDIVDFIGGRPRSGGCTDLSNLRICGRMNQL